MPKTSPSRSARAVLVASLALAAAATALWLSPATVAGTVQRGTPNLVMFAANDLGMHCMNDDYEDMLVLPPYNTMRAMILERRGSPEPITENLTVRYEIPSNTRAADKSNFWTHAQDLLGADLPPDIGLTGEGLSGQLRRRPGEKYYEVVGVPITPFDDDGLLNPYGLARLTADGPAGSAETIAVMPVSTELSCNLCHRAEGASPALDIIRKHDAKFSTDLESNRPVLCAGCHADNALALPGKPGISAFSHAMHNSHANRTAALNLENECYACHPGIRTACQRGNHFVAGVQCNQCHGGMTDVGDTNRNPWVDLPRCAECHTRPGFQFEEPGKLYKDSRGHGGVYCWACHGSTHATAIAATDADNAQAILRQGNPGIISGCTVCHTQMPSDPFPHRRDD